MSLSFPITLPSFLIRNYGIEPQDSVLRTAMEAGAPRYRQKFTQIPIFFDIEQILESDEYFLFISWFQTSINGGQDRFTVDLDLGDGLQTMEARFLSPPKAKRIDDSKYNVGGRLEVENPTLMDAELAEILSQITIDDLELMAQILSDLEELMASLP